MTGHGRRCVRVAATSCSGVTSHRSVTTTVKSTACAQSAPWAYQPAAADAAVVGVASQPWSSTAAPGRAEGGVEGPLHGLRIDRPSLRARFLEVEFRAPHLGRDFGALAGDLILGQPPVGFERFPIAPFVDGPALLGRPT